MWTTVVTRSAVLVAAPVVLVLLVSAAPAMARNSGHHSQPAAATCPKPRVACKKPADNTAFNYFAFQQSWSEEFCFGQALKQQNNKLKYPYCPDSWEPLPLCVNPSEYMCNALTIHGLWATAEGRYDYRKGQHGPYCCPAAPFDPDVFTDQLLKDLNTYWPDEAVTQSPSDQIGGFHEYEWDKHGGCSKMEEKTFFESAISVHKQLPTPFRGPYCNNGAGAQQQGMTYNQETGEYILTVPTATLAQQYRCKNVSHRGTASTQCVVFGCSHGFLSDVTTCWGDTDNDGTLDQIACGPSVTYQQDNAKCNDDIKIKFFPSPKCSAAANLPCGA